MLLLASEDYRGRSIDANVCARRSSWPMAQAFGRRHTGRIAAPLRHAAITFNPETGKYGFSVWMPGKRPHFQMNVLDSAEDARNWLDPHRERVWDRARRWDYRRCFACIQTG
jgi:hypothetical protein